MTDFNRIIRTGILFCFICSILFFTSGCNTSGVKNWFNDKFFQVKKILKIADENAPTPTPEIVSPTPEAQGTQPETVENQGNPVKGAPNFITSWGEDGVKPGQLKQPIGIAVDYDGNVYVADTNNCRVQKFTPKGEFIAAYGKRGSDIGQVDKPYDLAIWDGDIYITDHENSRIVRINSKGEFLSAKGNDGDDIGNFHQPVGICVDSEGNFFVADSGNNRIEKFNYNGLENNTAYKGVTVEKYSGPVVINNPWNSHFPKYNEGPNAGQFTAPWDVVTTPSGDIIVMDTYNHRIQKFGPDGEFIQEWGLVGSEKGQFQFPTFGELDQYGFLLVVDTGNNRIQKFTQDGELLAVWGEAGYEDGQFNQPRGIAVSPKTGDIFIADTENSRIERYSYKSKLKIWYEEFRGEKKTPTPSGSPTPKEVIF